MILINILLFLITNHNSTSKDKSYSITGIILYINLRKINKAISDLISLEFPLAYFTKSFNLSECLQGWIVSLFNKK